MKALAILFLLLSLRVVAQEETGTELAENFVLEDDPDSEEKGNYENYTHLLSHRLNLNDASKEQIRSLNVLSESQLQSLFAHLAENGDLLSVYELQSIRDFDVDIIRQLQKYIIIKDPADKLDKSLLKRIQEQGESYLMMRYERTIELKKGFSKTIPEDQQFRGTPERIAMRFRTYRPGDFSIGITAEKDPGETLSWKPHEAHYGTDYLSIHAQVQNKGKIKNLILGDFQAQFGQGLVWGGSMGFGKGAETITNTRRSNVGFVPYTSSYEAGNLRGAAGSFQLKKNLLLSCALSAVRRDATLQPNDSAESISSFQRTGLHRNMREWEKRRTITENIAGAVLQYEYQNLLIGTSFQHTGFSSIVAPRRSAYNQSVFRGDHNNNFSVFLNYAYHNIALFSEIAKSVNGGEGVVAGALLSLSRKFDVSFLFRHYDVNYYTFYANAFSENTRPENEKGIYWGWKYKFNKRFSHAGYFDVFSFPWLKFRTYAPSLGYEWLARLQWQPSKSTTAFVQVREENKTRNLSAVESTVYQLGAIKKQNFTFNLDYTISTGLRMKTRYQFSTFQFNSSRTTGSVLLQDISFQVRRVKCTARYALFDTDDYDNRQYVYEHDVWLAYSLPAYYGTGVRKYVLLQYKLNKMFTFWLRYSHTRYVDRENIGSGVEMISGNALNDIKFETRIKF